MPGIMHDYADKIAALPKFNAANTLDRLRAFIDFMGAPDADMNIIHVAGTNGKGSVCEFMSSILNEAGYKTGMFISPHLVSMNERFRINGKPVDDSCFLYAYNEVWRLLNIYNEKAGGWSPVFSEYLLCMALVIFKREKPDWVILETGLGGRLDATSCVISPKLCAITEIGMDHMQYLGNSIELIAGEKAGIIRTGVPVVFADRGNESTRVIRNHAYEKGAASYALRVQKDASALSRKAGAVVCKIMMTAAKQIDFSYISEYDRYNNLLVNSTALYQAENAGIAILSAEILQRSYESADRITHEGIIRGIGKAFWEGRMEELESGFYIDGAHNCDGILAFVESASAITSDSERDAAAGRILIFGAVADKQYEDMLSILAKSGIFNNIVLCMLETERTVSYEKLQEMAAAFTAEYTACKFSCYDSVKSALNAVRRIRQKKDIVFTAGSLFLTGQIKLEYNNGFLERHG